MPVSRIYSPSIAGQKIEGSVERGKRVREKLDKAGIIAAIKPEDYFDDFAAAIARCDARVSSNSQMAHERQVVLSEYAESFLKTSESYLRGAQNSRGEG